MQEGQFVNTEDKDLFLHIDGVSELMDEYCRFLDEKEGGSKHTVLFYGDTGCGKGFFSNECIRKVKEKNSEVVVIDLLDNFRASNFGSEKKLNGVLEIIEYDLIAHGAFDELKGKNAKPEMFKWILEKQLKEKKMLLLIRFPQIEVYDEIEKYCEYLDNDNTIIYFISERKAIVDACRKKYEKEIKYFELERLKQGDGKLIIDNIFSKEEFPQFDVNDLESLMSKRPINNKMTIRELLRVCNYAYAYAKENKIKYITSTIIAEAIFAKSSMI